MVMIEMFALGAVSGLILGLCAAAGGVIAFARVFPRVEVSVTQAEAPWLRPDTQSEPETVLEDTPEDDPGETVEAADGSKFTVHREGGKEIWIDRYGRKLERMS